MGHDGCGWDEVGAQRGGRRLKERAGDLGVRAQDRKFGEIPGRGSRPCGRDRCVAEGKGLASGPGWSVGAAWRGRSAEGGTGRWAGAAGG